MLDKMGLDQRIWKPMLNFIAHLRRFNKVAGTPGHTWTCTNSIIQGCSMSLLATAALSSVRARALEEEVPAVLCNSIVDDRRLCATGRTAPALLQSAIQLTQDFDRATGTRFNPLKSTCATPARWMEKDVQHTADRFGMKTVSFEKQVGYPVTYKGNRDRNNQNKRIDEATRTVARIARLPRGFGFEARARLIETNAIPEYQFAIECGTPSEQSLGGLTSQIMRTLWPTGANMRSREIVLAVLVKGHRTDPMQVWAYQTLTILRTMLRSNTTWTPLWQQAWEAMGKRRIRPGTEGLAANATRVLRRLGWSWESALEVKTREGEEARKATGNIRSGKQRENGDCVRQPTGKQPKTWRRSTFKCPLDC